MSGNTRTTTATTSPKYCNCCKSENCRGRALAAWGFKMVTIVADWFKRTFPATFNKMLEGMKDKDEECRQTFAKIFSLSDSQLPWKQDAAATGAATDSGTKQSPEFQRSHAYTGGLSEEEQTARAMEESLKEHQEANLLYRHLASAPPSEPPSYNSIYCDQGGIPAAYIPPAPPSAREETQEVTRQRKLYPQL